MAIRKTLNFSPLKATVALVVPGKVVPDTICTLLTNYGDSSSQTDGLTTQPYRNPTVGNYPRDQGSLLCTAKKSTCSLDLVSAACSRTLPVATGRFMIR